MALQHTFLQKTCISILPKKLPKASHSWLVFFCLGNFSSVRFPTLASDLFSKYITKILCLPLVVHPCYYRKSKSHLCKNLCILGVSHPFTKPHSKNLLQPLDLVRPSKLTFPSTDMSLGLMSPILGHTLLALCSLLMAPCGCTDGAFQSLWCSHDVEGRQVHSFRMIPSCSALIQEEPKSLLNFLSQVRCVPPWFCMSPLCIQGSHSHT